MNLLDATTTLIDTAKTYAPENDAVIARAIKRMEKRLFVLQVRSAKARKRNRVKAFWDAMGLFKGGASGGPKSDAVIPCKVCDHLIGFGEFCKHAEFTGGGRIETLTCPNCNNVMVRE